jgi:leader peptidase (prepilin peptidase)/N-methyltransferase
MVAFVWLGLGLIVGSFTNVLILREGIGSLRGRSACPTCKTTLSARDLVPVFSWLFLRARCRTCRAPISVQYPLVEMVVGLGFFAVGSTLMPLHLKVIACAIIVFLVAIAVYDLHTMLMPNAWVWTWNLLALAFTYVWLWEVGAESVEYVRAFGWGAAVAMPLYALNFFSRGAWMGFGDVKFALGMGFLLGPYGLLALFYAFLSGAFVGLVMVFLSSPRVAWLRALVTPIHDTGEPATRVTMKSEVPFGPFLILGTVIVWFALFHAHMPTLTFLGALPGY